jgi:hypothetical protein
MNCRNCKTSLNNESDYCNSCGGKIIRNRLTIRNLFEYFSEEFLNYDNKLFQTFITLFRKPEAVIGGYINGTRKKYVNVISYFAIAITLSGLQIYILQKYSADFDDIFANGNSIIAEQQKQINNKIFQFITDYQSIIMMLYIPFYALLAKLIFLKNKLYNYTELLVVFMYAQAQYSIITAILTFTLIPLGVPFIIFSFLLIPLQFFYFAFCLKDVYHLNFTQILLKTLLFIFVLGFIVILISIVGIGLAILFKDSELIKFFIETQKAIQ